MLAGVVIDALDVARMEEFWAEATQGRTHGLYLRFEAATKPKAGKNPVSLLMGRPHWPTDPCQPRLHNDPICVTQPISTGDPTPAQIGGIVREGCWPRWSRPDSLYARSPEGASRGQQAE